MHMSFRVKGILMVLIAAICWGAGGIFLQYLLEVGYEVGWLISTRFILAGLIMLTIVNYRQPQSIWKIWKNKHDVISLILLSILGFVAGQFTFIFTMKHSNVVTATILGYLAPAMIVCYFAIHLKRLPSFKETVALLLAIIGTFLVVTKGHFSSLAISGWALVGGLSSGAAMAFYSIQPQKLLAKWNSILVIGWSMLIGGVFSSFFYQPWDFNGVLSLKALFAFLITVIAGMVLSYSFYIESLKFINPSEAGIVATFEPLFVAIVSAIWLNIAFSFVEWLGLICIISTVIVLSLNDKQIKSLLKRKSNRRIHQKRVREK